MDQNKSGKFIAKLRKEKNMTQEQLAEKMLNHFCVGTVIRWSLIFLYDKPNDEWQSIIRFVKTAKSSILIIGAGNYI